MSRELAGSAAPQPYFPDTKLQFVWDSTSLGWLKTCPRLYQYQMIEGWIPNENRVHLTFGIWYHSSLEQYDHAIAQGLSHDEAVDRALKYALEVSWERKEIDGIQVSRPWRSDHNLKTRETLIRSVVWYLDHFKDHPVQTLILSDGKPAVELSFKMDMPGMEGYMLAGHLDRVVSWNNALYVMDRKTTGSTLSSYYFSGFEPDNQMTLYTLAAKVIYHAPVQGVIIDGAQVAVGFTRFGRGFTHRSDAQLQEWVHELKFWMGQAEAFAKANYWPMNDKACGMYGGCTFRKICSKSPEARPAFLAGDFVRHPWNPLESR